MFKVFIYLKTGQTMTLVMYDWEVKRLKRWWNKRIDDPRSFSSDVDSATDGYGLDMSQIACYKVLCE